MTAPLPDFASFYRAVNGRDPFPWQRRLAAQVQASGWPSGVGVGTGLGKTSCLDIAVWTMAAEHELRPAERKLPTRVWYVVNRRLLVDAAYEHGMLLAGLLADPSIVAREEAADAIAAVAEALRARQGGAGSAPLHVSRLRGNAELGVRPPDPSQPALIFATVPMFASRWLFRGFGTSTSMRPVDAALAGIDSLVLLDEAHLARALTRLAGPLAACDIGNAAVVLPAARARPVIVPLTATGESDTFTLDDEDDRNPIVRRRLDADKPVRLVAVSKAKVVEALANHTVEALQGRQPTAAVVFCNAPGTARSVLEALALASSRRKDPLDADLVLLTGRMREREAALARALVLDPATGAPAGRTRPSTRSRHLVVVATQTLEVGADLDFDVLVTEACGARALIQRMGRLNRLGQAEDAAGVVVFPKGATEFGIYGDEPLAVWQRLESCAIDGVVNMAPRHVADAVGPPGDSPPRVGELLPSHLWEWAKTSAPPPGEAPGELFYQGFDATSATVSIVWRALVPKKDAQLRPSVTADEAIDVPLGEARQVLADLVGSTVARLRPDGVTVETGVPVSRLRPGDVVVLPTDAGGCDAYGWAPDARATVLDASLLRGPGLPLNAGVLNQVFGAGEDLDEAIRIAELVAVPPEPDEEIDRPVLVQSLLEHLRLAGPSPLLHDGEWADLTSRLQASVVYFPDEDKGRLQVLAPPKKRQVVELRADAFDELSCAATSVILAEHLGSVGQLAGRVARHVGLPDELVEAVTVAGRFHDLGKVDHRFQRWLDPLGVAAEPVAKSSTLIQHWKRDREAAGWPAGGRHEELSRRLVAAYLESNGDPGWDTDLVLHLVVSHHGFGRPVVLGVADLLPITVIGTVDGARVQASGDLAAVDWEQPARFHRCCERYGYWGLALLEAILRQADHQVSQVVVA